MGDGGETLLALSVIVVVGMVVVSSGASFNLTTFLNYIHAGSAPNGGGGGTNTPPPSTPSPSNPPPSGGGSSGVNGGDGEDYLLWQNGITQLGTNYMGAWSTLLAGQISQWHFNTFRLAFSFSDCAVNPTTGKHTHSVIDFAKMDAVITYLYAHGYHVVLDLHNWDDMYQYVGSPSWHANWKSVAQHYKGDTRIIAYELFNEPYNSVSAIPLQTETWYPAAVASRADLARQYASLTDEIRLIDSSRTVVWADPADYLQTASMTPLPTEAVRTNVIFAWHGWNGNPANDNSISLTVQVETKKLVRIQWWQQEYPNSKQWLGEFGQYPAMNYTCQQALCVAWVNACVQNHWNFCVWLWYENCHYNNANTYPEILSKSNY